MGSIQVIKRAEIEAGIPDVKPDSEKVQVDIESEVRSWVEIHRKTAPPEPTFERLFSARRRQLSRARSII